MKFGLSVLKKSVALLILFLFVFITTGCNNETEDSQEKYENVLGEWVYSDDPTTKEQSLFLYDDKTFVIKNCLHNLNEYNCDNGFSFYSGTYKITNNIISLLYENSKSLISGDFYRSLDRFMLNEDNEICNVSADGQCGYRRYRKRLVPITSKIDITKVTLDDAIENPLSLEEKNLIINYLDRVISELNTNSTKLLNNKDYVDFKYKTYYFNDDYYFKYIDSNQGEIKFTISKNNDKFSITSITLYDGKNNMVSSAVRNELPRNAFFQISNEAIKDIKTCINSYIVDSCGKEVVVMALGNGYLLFKNIEIN